MFAYSIRSRSHGSQASGPRRSMRDLESQPVMARGGPMRRVGRPRPRPGSRPHAIRGSRWSRPARHGSLVRAILCSVDTARCLRWTRATRAAEARSSLGVRRAYVLPQLLFEDVAARAAPEARPPARIRVAAFLSDRRHRHTATEPKGTARGQASPQRGEIRDHVRAVIGLDHRFAVRGVENLSSSRDS